MYSANESSTYMTSVGKGGGAGGPAKGLAPAHFFPLEGPGDVTELTLAVVHNPSIAVTPARR